MNKYIMAILGCAFILMGCNSDYNTNAGEKDVNDHTEKNMMIQHHLHRRKVIHQKVII